MGGRFAPDSVDTGIFNPRKRWRRCPRTRPSLLVRVVAGVDSEAEFKEEVVQEGSWPEGRRYCYRHFLRHSKGKVAYREDCQSLSGERQYSSCCWCPGWKDCVTETNCETLSIGVRLTWSSEVLFRRTVSFKLENILWPIYLYLSKFCWYFI